MTGDTTAILDAARLNRRTNRNRRTQRHGLGVTSVRRDLQAWTLIVDCSLGQHGPLAHHRPAHALADLRGVQVKLRQGAAQCVAMHAQLGRGFALVPFVVREYFEDVAPLELSDGIRVRHTGTVHLRH
jgi:hypothetical protein